MRERPILFSAPMVRALLDGSKTQTRRLAKFKPYEAGINLAFSGLDAGLYHCGRPDAGWVLRSRGAGACWNDRTKPLPCPYGVPGDRLWVRETWYCDDFTAGDLERARVGYVGKGPSDAEIVAGWRSSMEYRATHDCTTWEAGCPCRDDDGGSCWRPSIFMPRWASRIALDVTSVRVERLHAITEADAWAEGIAAVDGALDEAAICRAAKLLRCCVEDARATYGALWAEINGEHSLIANPWVWVVEFVPVDGRKKLAATAEIASSSAAVAT